MSYTSFHDGGNNDFTFRNKQNCPALYHLPPPPLTSPYQLTAELTDQDYVQNFGKHTPQEVKRKLNKSKISELQTNLYNLVLSLNDLKIQEQNLSENIDILSEEEWNAAFGNIQTNKDVIQTMISKLSSSILDRSRKYVAKRTAKRLRLKRLKEERKRVRIERIRKLEERSRKIDENLQKIQDDIWKNKQEEEAKIKADILLKEVLRKKHDAKKCIAKLEALLKLRRARLNTARGRGQDASDLGASVFQNSIDRIQKLWEIKLLTYEKEESESRAQLDRSNEQRDMSSLKEIEVKNNLMKWREVLFGAGNPQVDFNGDLAKFVDVRSQWDRYIDASADSEPLPVGWVVLDFAA